MMKFQLNIKLFFHHEIKFVSFQYIEGRFRAHNARSPNNQAANVNGVKNCEARRPAYSALTGPAQAPVTSGIARKFLSKPTP
jgi:hypothetical protein